MFDLDGINVSPEPDHDDYNVQSSGIIAPDMAGCWLDGAYGWHNHYRVVDVAEEYGFVLSPDQRILRNRYEDIGSLSCPLSDDDWEAMMELVDRATGFLNELAPQGYEFVWDAGELLLRKVDDNGNEILS